MSNSDEKHIHQRLERLSRIDPSQKATDRAMQRVRETIGRGRSMCLPWTTTRGRPYGLLFMMAKLTAAAVLMISVAFLAGRFSAPKPLDTEALQTSIRQELLNEMENRLQTVIASQRESLKQELHQQVGHDMKLFAEQILTAVGNFTDQRFLEFAQMVEAARIKDRQRVAAAFNYMGSRFGDGLVTLAAHTSELERTEQN